MKILMISPHPTYSPRGTPISVLNRCRALSALGHEVDLVTYGIGEDVELPGLTWIRAGVPGIRSVRVGPSPSKVPLDLAVFFRAAVLALRGRRRYDVIHGHEEGGLVGVLLSIITGVPHVYDMGNDLGVVLGNYGLGARHPFRRIAVFFETLTIKLSRAVIVHFPSLCDRVESVRSGPPAFVVPNVAFEAPVRPERANELRSQWGGEAAPVILYTGTFEPYQGLELLLEAVAELLERGRAVVVVLVGGRPGQRQALAEKARSIGIEAAVVLPGLMDHNDIPSALCAADVLVSPRLLGTNTPLKIFSYLGSGKPVVVTKIESHTQVLDASVCELVDPEPVALANGLERVLDDPELASRYGTAGRQLISECYGPHRYIRAVANAYDALGGQSVDDRGVARAARAAETAMDST